MSTETAGQPDAEGLERARQAAAREAAWLVQTGMRVGLGTGRAAVAAIRFLGQRIRDENLSITGLPTSESSRSLAHELGIPLLDDACGVPLDITLDGADEADRHLSVIKGAGGALVREKLVAASSHRVVLIIEEPKLVQRLGGRPLPVAVVPFGWRSTAERLLDHCESLELRIRDGAPFVTDDGLYILDLRTGPIADPPALEGLLRGLVGVVEVGLFTGLCDLLVVGLPDGTVTRCLRSS